MLLTLQVKEKETDRTKIKCFLVLFAGCSDMGCHIDGFISLVAHTHVLQEGPVTGRAADVIAAANTAAEVALRLVRPGRKVIHSAYTISISFPYSIVVCITHELVCLSYN